MQNQKDLFFYSNFCEFSKDVIGIITKHNLKDSFMLVCVDNKKYNIPNFIDRVPSILRTSGEVYTDEQLYGYLETKYRSSNIEEQISPMTSTFGNSMYSTNFSSVTGDDSSLENKNYLTIGREQHMIHVNENMNTNSKKSYDSSAAFETLMQNRKMDDKFIKQSLDNRNR
jgi:hypothetical protein